MLKSIKVILVIFCLTALSINFTYAGSSFINISWTVPADDGLDCLTGDPSVYIIKYSTEEALTEENWDDAIIVPNDLVPLSCGSEQSFKINGLEPNTTYYIGMKVGDEVPNWSGITNWSCATPDIVAPGSAIPSGCTAGTE